MSDLVGILALCIAAIAVFSFLAKKKKPPEIEKTNNSYLISKPPLSPPEQLFYFRLIKAVPELIVLPQVAFSRFLDARGGTQKNNFALFGTVRQKVADYLICDESFSIICIIELDDKRHNKEKDEIRDANLKSSGISSIRLKVNQRISLEALKDLIYENSTKK